MAGHYGPLSRALANFDPWLAFREERPIATDAIVWALANPAAYEAERAAGQAKINALFAAHDARSLAAQQARWDEEEGEEIVARMNRSSTLENRNG